MKNSTNKLLTAAVIVLLLANIAMVVMMVSKKKNPSRGKGRGGPTEMMTKELGLSEQQQKDFQQLRDEHFKNIRPVFDTIRSLKTAFFEMVKNPETNDSMLSAYSNKVAEKQAVLDKLTFAHFQRVRALFDTSQQRKFDELMIKMMQRGGPGRKKDSTEKKQE